MIAVDTPYGEYAIEKSDDYFFDLNKIKAGNPVISAREFIQADPSIIDNLRKFEKIAYHGKCADYVNDVTIHTIFSPTFDKDGLYQWTKTPGKTGFNKRKIVDNLVSAMGEIESPYVYHVFREKYNSTKNVPYNKMFLSSIRKEKVESVFNPKDVLKQNAVEIPVEELKVCKMYLLKEGNEGTVEIKDMSKTIPEMNRMNMKIKKLRPAQNNLLKIGVKTLAWETFCTSSERPSCAICELRNYPTLDFYFES